MATDKAASDKAMAKRYRREMDSAVTRTYNRLVKSFVRDAECKEADAKEWLKSIGIEDPSPKK